LARIAIAVTMSASTTTPIAMGIQGMLLPPSSSVVTSGATVVAEVGAVVAEVAGAVVGVTAAGLGGA
jgi:hypothetical protein